MEGYEYKAPMYHNFEEESSDRSDYEKFFDSTGPMCETPVKDEPQTTMQIKDEPRTPMQIKDEPRTPMQIMNSTFTAYSTSETVAVDELRTSMEISSSSEASSDNKENKNEKEEPMVENSEMDDVIVRAMRKLCSTPHKNVSKLQDNPFRAADKRRGSPLINEPPRKYISLAESVKLFETQTPERFHTQPNTARWKPSQMGCIRRKLITIPSSPNLLATKRTRNINYPTREELEEKELEEMKKYKLKPLPLNEKILYESPKLGVRVEKKPQTVPVPFNLTKVVKRESKPAPPVYHFKARPMPSNFLRRDHMEKEESLIVNISTPERISPTYSARRTIRIKKAEKKVSENGVHCFNSAGGIQKKHHTESKPFTFEERDKEMQRHKEERIQKVLDEERKAREFHANPLPLNVLNSPFIPRKSQNTSTTLQEPFQLKLDERCLKRQETFRKKLEEEAREREELASFKAHPATVLQRKPFEPNHSEHYTTEPVHVELNTDKRAREREEFDRKVRLQQQKLEELRKQREEKQLKEELQEVEKMRKEAVPKANPIRRYKPVDIKHSDKPLTDPESPPCFRKKK